MINLISARESASEVVLSLPTVAFEAVHLQRKVCSHQSKYLMVAVYILIFY